MLSMFIIRNGEEGVLIWFRMINMNASEVCGNLMSSGFIGKQQIMKRCLTTLLFKSIHLPSLL